MKILLISDSHNSSNLARFLEIHKKMKKIICLGDFIINKELLDKFNVTYVIGNCDRYSKPLENVIDINGLKAFITHGHKYNVKKIV
ncbi:MAG: metallophosphatase family protein [Clostridium sp.]|nr:MAG: metallophosphatase family protein [Clostridium sp.]